MTHDDSIIALRDFIDAFAEMHREDEHTATTFIASAYLTCFSMMSIKERDRLTAALMIASGEMSQERFEDGQDFIAFLTEKDEEHKQMLKHLEEKDK